MRIIAKHGAVVSELVNYYRIGIDVLKEGGSVVDVAIATELCVGTINAFSAGIGGYWRFNVIHLPNGTAEFIDTREIAPHIANKRMFVKHPNSASIGGLSVGVPGEINGMKVAHERYYGKLPWKRLFEPSIKLSCDGFPVSKELDIRLKKFRNELEQDPALSAVYAPSGELLEKGEIPHWCLLTWLILKNREVARSLIKEINGRDGIMSREDFKNYKIIIREPVIGYYHGKKIITTSELRWTIPHIYVKFVGKFRDQFAHETRIQEIISKEFAALVRANVLMWVQIIKNKIVFMDKNDMAVSFTSTVNLIWGSRVLDTVTGILLNDEIDDFSIPGAPNHFGLRPSPYNFVGIPLSSTIPTTVENENGKVELMTGGNGGSNAVLQVLLNLYDFDMSLLDAINSPRIHHQLLPNL
ncbi:8541_t:CDS:10, partial [Gigaspora margarita]